VLGAALGPLSTRDCLVLALLSGIAEEALFRAALQPDVGLVAASLLFGLAHLAPRRELAPWTLFAVAAGLLFGALFDATGNLVAPCVAHFLVNAINLRRLAPRPPTA
jgi:membrane protease YdiL (CAAX protease family)